MPRRSKVELSEETISKLEEQFFNFIHSLTPEDSKKFFNEFLTTEEKMMMYKRLALYWSLFEGYSLASIQKMLGVTHDTTRIYNKKKNMMSEEFKYMVSKIGRGENQPMKQEEASQPEEPQQVSEPEQQVQPEQDVQEQPEVEESQQTEEPQQAEESQPKEETSQAEETPQEEEPKKKRGFGKFFGF